MSGLFDLQYKKLVFSKLKSLFLQDWFHIKDNVSGKLDTYFCFKSSFQKEKYLDINNFKERQILCKFRISAHNLRIQTNRHKRTYIKVTEVAQDVYSK